MKKITLLSLILFCLNLDSYGQIVPFGSSWKYYINTSSPSIPPPVSGINWTSPSYVTNPPWDISSSNAPFGTGIGYPSSPAIISTIPVPASTSLGNNFMTSYYRKTISDPNLLYYTSFNINLKADDGVIIYFNGIEVFRNNMPSSGIIDASTQADIAVTGSSTTTFNNNITLTPSTIIPGLGISLASILSSHPTANNLTITAEVHQSGIGGGGALYTSSTDSYFDFELTGILGVLPPTITRGPYLQLPHPAGMQVRWRTNTSLVGRVCFGTSSGSLTTCFNDDNSTPAFDHIVNLSGLTPNTTYFYAVQHTTGSLIEASTNHKFTTPPISVDNTKTTRIWVTGDASEEIGSATKIPRQDEVLNGFKTYQAANPSSNNLDLWLLLGDNAHTIGNEEDYSTRFFNPYDDMNTTFTATNNNQIMKQTPLMPCVGDHDYYHDGTSSTNDISSGDQLTIRSINDFVSPFTTLNAPMNTFYVSTSGKAISNYRVNKNSAFYDIFSLPNGTTPANLSSKYSTSNSLSKKAYYSYNHNNIHFICLDSYGFYNNHLLYAGIPTWPTLPNAADNPQMAWLMADLAANTSQKWTIMYWHHSPYTRGGGHFSDNLIADEYLLVGIREKLIKYLDASGRKIDLVLNGHSNSYERSRLLKGHYAAENTFSSAVHNNNPSAYANHNGKFISTALECPYVKSSSSASNEGIVYVVTGSAGQIEPSAPLAFKGHLALNGAVFNPSTLTDRGTIEESRGGSFYIEVLNNRLDAKFIDETGAVGDNFTILKDVNSNVPLVKNISVFELPLQSPSLQRLNGPFFTGISSNYSLIPPIGSGLPTITGLSTPILVTTPQVGPLYTVTDNTGCLTKNVRFHFDGNCWGNITINNLIDSPVFESIKSTGIITANNVIKPALNPLLSKVRYWANNSVNLTPLFNAMPGSIFTGFVAPNISSCFIIIDPPSETLKIKDNSDK